MIRYSKGGGVNGQILKDIFEALDNLDLFDRSGGKIPVAIIDGHGSRFSVVFLRYMHDIRHRWTPLLGVPYETHKWQVGDSSQQNGTFSQESTRGKRELF